MVWPFTSSDAGNPPSNDKADPYSKLDASLKEFLARESPGRYHESKAPKRELTSLEKVNQARPKSDAQASSETPSSHAPAASLYPDGRYAHLWKTYRTRADIENEHKTDQEKLQAMMQHYQDKKDLVSKAALENCAAINVTLDECFRRPKLKQRMVMCRDETRALNRCLDMNKRFLKALGYLSVVGEEDKEEAIQMHADKLYTRMLEQEERTKALKAQDKEETPADDEPAEPFFKDDRKEATAIFALLNEEGRERLKERTKGMGPAEKELEERVFAAELRAGRTTMERVDKYRGEVRAARLERIATGNARMMDRFQAWFGW